jgi:hypothetical protein
LVPVEIPVTAEVGEVGVVITPVPETKVHKPVPTTGVLPVKVPLLTQIV